MTSLPLNSTDSILFLRQDMYTGIISYSQYEDDITWNDILSYPISFTSTSNLVVRLLTRLSIDSLFNLTDSLFIINSDRITFDGQDNIIEIKDIDNFKGIFKKYFQ